MALGDKREVAETTTTKNRLLEAIAAGEMLNMACSRRIVKPS